MSILQNKDLTKHEPVFKWEVKIGDDIVELSDASFEKLMKCEKEGVRLVKIGDRMINPAYITSARKVYKQNHTQVSDVLDWETMNFSEEKKIPDEKATENREKIMEDIRAMIKEKMITGPYAQVRDEQHAIAVADVWEHLKTHLNEIKPPVRDLNWKVDKSIISHQEGRESHPVTYYTKEIDLGDNYDKNFWCEAAYIHCDSCNKTIKNEIRIYNDYEGQCVIRTIK